MRSERWWPCLALSLLFVGCGPTRNNCEPCAHERTASAGDASGGSSASGAGASGGTAPVGGTAGYGGTALVGGQTNQGGAALYGCNGAPEAPLVPYSQVDLEWTMNDVVGPGPSFLPAYEARSDAGEQRIVSAGFIAQLQTLAGARLDAASLSGRPLTPCDVTDGACVATWLRERGLRIYRRPLSDEQVAGYFQRFEAQADTESPELAARAALLSMFLSPYFVFRIELGVPVSKALTIAPPGGGAPLPPLLPRGNPLSSYEVAARLSHFAWRSGPDAALLSAAAADQLQRPEQVLAAFDRLLADPRSLRARTLQQLEWLHLEQWGALEPQTPSDITPLQRAQTEGFIGDVLQARDGSLTELLTSPRQPLNQTLAKQMGVDAAVGDAFEPVELDAAFYAGVLGQGAWLSRNARPTARGAHILSQLLCSEIPAPPANEPGLGPGATPRERITSVTAGNPPCQTCHQLIDPVGFALEAFDDQGRLTGFDTSGQLRSFSSGSTIELAGPRELGQAVANSDEAKRCAARGAVEHLVQAQLRDPNDRVLLDCLVQGVGASDLSLNQLARQIAVSDAMLHTRRDPSSAVGVGDAADPVQHAIEETRGLILGLSPEDGQPLQQYISALREVQSSPSMP